MVGAAGRQLAIAPPTVMSLSATQRFSFSINGFGFRLPNSDAFKSKFSYDAEIRDSTVSNGDPYAAEFTILQGDMKILEPERGTSGGYTFDLADAETVGVNPNLSAQKVSIFPLR